MSKLKQKIKYPAYTGREAVHAAIHESMVSRKKLLDAQFLTALGGLIVNVSKDECDQIRTRADARIAKAQEELYKKQGEK